MPVRASYFRSALASLAIASAAQAAAERCNPPYKICGQDEGLTYECPPCPPGGPHWIVKSDENRAWSEKERAFKLDRAKEVGDAMTKDVVVPKMRDPL